MKKNLIQAIHSIESSNFTKDCYLALLKIPKGKVTTYALLAKHLNSKAARVVGSAMRKNPFAPEVPCHRVVRSGGSIGQYNGGTDKKIKLLKQEGLKIKDGKVVNFKEVLFNFT